MHLYIGCAVWAYRGWIGDFYPPGSSSSELLTLYAKRMTCVEGNTTFYAIPEASTVEAWASQLPRGFKFCPKIYKGYTHEGMLCDRLEAIDAFRRRMEGFGEHLGPVMLQLPPGYGPAAFDDLARFLDHWRASTERALMVELRHKSWWLPQHAQPLHELLKSYDVGKVLLDVRPVYEAEDDPQLHSERRKPEVPLSLDLTHDSTIIRYIGHPRAELNEPYLDQWAEVIATWLTQGVSVYFFAHCPQEERSPEYARAMYRRLKARLPELDPLPWELLPAQPKQLGLF